jgi:hypothetical protein
MALFARAAQLVQVSVVGVLATLSLPGVHAARAEGGLLPPASQLFAWNAPRHEPAPVSCAAGSEAVQAATQARREAAMAQVAELLRGVPGGGSEVLNGRGYAYPTVRDPQRELLMVELEARRQRALRAAGGPEGR